VASFTERAIGAARLDRAIYEEVEHDAGATPQAAAVVVLASLAFGVGHAGQGGGLLTGMVASLLGWVVWATITWLVGTRLLPTASTHADLGQLLRTIGFSAAPGVLAIFALVPLVGWLVALAAALWQLVAMVVAVRQALDYPTTARAVAVCAVGFLGYVLVAGLVLGGLRALAT